MTYFRVGISRTKKKRKKKKRKHRKVPFAENLSLSKFLLYTPADSFACYACYGNSTLLIFTFPSVHLTFSSHRSLNREGRWGTKDDFATSFLHFFPVLHCPLGLAELQDCPFPDIVFKTSSSVCFVFFPLSLCLARWFWPDLMNGIHDHTTAVCVSLRWSGGLRVVRLPAGSWHGLPRW